MRIPDKPIENPDHAELETIVDSAISKLDDLSPVIWCARPWLAAGMSGASYGTPPSVPKIVASLSRKVSRMRQRPLSGHLAPNDVLFYMATINHRRALEPVLNTMAVEAPGVGLQVVPTHYAVGKWFKQAARDRHLLRQALDARRGDAWDRRLLQAFSNGALALAKAEALMEQCAASVLMLSDQTVNGRAILALAWRDRRLTVYVPHAPVMANRQYMDLPIGCAALRSKAEVECYVKWGAGGALYDSGNPMIPDAVAGNVAGDVKGRVLFAPSPRDESDLRRQVQLLEAATDEGVLVSPHPRSDLSTLRRIVPSSWPIEVDRRTAYLLAGGPVAVVQASSGVTWEALYWGVPVIDISPESSPSQYVLSYSPAVGWARTSEQLSAFLTAAPRMDRQYLRDVARTWCSSVGTEAADRVASAVDKERKVSASTSRPILDGWFRETPLTAAFQDW